MADGLTRDQRRAIKVHDRNLVVVAAAGSGKTHVLVERYLALLDAHPDWPLDSLVAITFTRKAAREMRERVRRELQQRAQSAEAPQRGLWQTHLASVDSARIDTIHGLCARLLRVSAAEAGIDPDFDVLDESLVDIELERALEQELERLAAANDPALTLFGAYDRKQITDALLELVKQPTLTPLPEDLLQHWQQAWNAEALAQLDALRESDAFVDAVKWQRDHSWPNGDKLGDIWVTCRPLLYKLDDSPEPARALELMSELSSTIRLNVGSAKNWGSKETLAEAKDVLRDLRVEVHLALAATGDGITDLDHRAAQLLPHWQRMIGLVQDAFRARKRDANLLDFNDLERLTCDVLEKPDVRDRFRREFHQVLVDEFHDTSPLQWQIIRALADPSDPGRLFIVGDPRQSIYAFRGADVRVFYEARHQILDGGGEEISLSHSFRAHQPLLDLLNTTFSKVLQRVSSGSAAQYEVEFGEALEAQRQAAPGLHPALELMLLDYKEAGLNEREGHSLMAQSLGLRLRELVEQQVPVYDRTIRTTRSLGYGDVALLFQTYRSMTFYEDTFKELALPYVTVGGRGFYGRQEVLDLLNLLRFLHNHNDELALASVLRSPLFALSDDALLALRLLRYENDSRPPLWGALQQPRGLPEDEMSRAHAAGNCLRELAQLAGRLSVDELLRAALQRTGYLATLTGLPDGHRRRGNVEKLVEKAAESGALHFTDFEMLLGEFSAREQREGEAALEADGALTLMTVHQAKGLEFPLVVLADAGRWRTPPDDSVLMRDEESGLACKVFDMELGKHQPTVAWQLSTRRKQQRELAERRRLFYVAATRAQDYLLVCGLLEDNKPKQSWLAWLQDALEIENLSASGTISVGRGQLCWRFLAVPSVLEPGVEPLRLSDSERENLAAQNYETPPPLLCALPTYPARAPQQLSVTSISRHYERVVASKSANDGQDRSSRVLGDAVHEMLRWWRPDTQLDANSMRQRLRSTIRAQGLRNLSRTESLVERASSLLEDFERSALCAQVKEARQLLRELPFIYQRDGYLIDGRLDLLMLDAVGRWTLVDFKTTWLGEGVSLTAAREHARRYHMQLGLYAEAVCQHPAVEASSLTVQLHYLQHALDVTVPTVEWQGALSHLEEFALLELQADNRAD